ncbi:MAG TPA: Calx-beta domain-containing protein, partial [Thermoanaerobaculia bacterium]
MRSPARPAVPILAAVLLFAPAAFAQPGGGPPGGGPGGGNGGGNGAAGENVLKFDQRNFQVWEETGEAVVSIERFKGSEGEVSVGFEIVGGTATAGTDYEEVSATLTWADGDTERKTVTIPILDDDEFEVFETIELALVDPTGGATLHPGHGTAVVMIKDAREDNPGQAGDLDLSPGTLRFVDVEAQGVEGDEATVRVQRLGGRLGAVSVSFATADGSATAGDDYATASGTLSWADGEMGIESFVVDLLDDEDEEGNETVLLTLSDPTGGATLDPARSGATLNVLDDDGSTEACGEDDETLCLADGRFQVAVDWRTDQGTSGVGHVEAVSDSTGLVWFFSEDNPGQAGDLDLSPGTLRFVDVEAQGVEGDEATVRVQRIGGRLGAVAVSFATADGSATAGDDYVAVSGTLSWADGEMGIKSFVVDLLDDEDEEGNETVLLTLSDPTGGATLDPARSGATLN